MRKRSKLSKTRQNLAAEYFPLAKILARYFVQSRPAWQRGLFVDDLEAEGLLALTKAARTYDKTKLPYPKAYFARAMLNGMLKWIKKETRQPAENKLTLEEAADLKPKFDELDHVRLAIEELDDEDQELAWDRFMRGSTLRKLAEDHQIPLRIASLRSQRLSKRIAESLDIRLQPRDKDSVHLRRNTSQPTGRNAQASCNPCGKNAKRWPGK
jgi:RNA polymerase sigma factor (sigma-70 family)